MLHKTQEKNSKNADEKTANAEHADNKREKKKGKSGESGRVALSGMDLGDMDISRDCPGNIQALSRAPGLFLRFPGILFMCFHLRPREGEHNPEKLFILFVFFVPREKQIQLAISHCERHHNRKRIFTG